MARSKPASPVNAQSGQRDTASQQDDQLLSAQQTEVSPCVFRLAHAQGRWETVGMPHTEGRPVLREPVALKAGREKPAPDLEGATLSPL